MFRYRSRPRLPGVLTVLALGVGGSLATTTPVQAAPVPRTYTTVMAPTTAIPGVATSYSVVVTNTSTRISALDHFVLSVPSGFTVTVGTVTAPRGGWTESLDSTGTTLTAATSQGVRHGLRKGEFLTMTFTATDGTACDTRTVTWSQKADGVIIDPWVAASPDPTVQMTPIADRFVVTSVTDSSTPPLVDAVVVDRPLSTPVCSCARVVPAPTGAASTLSLLKASAGTPTTAACSVKPPRPVAAGATTAPSWRDLQRGGERSGRRCGLVGGLGLPLAFPLDVLGAADTKVATPDVPPPVDPQCDRQPRPWGERHGCPGRECVCHD